MAIAPLLIGPVASLLDDVLKRVLPEKMSEAEKVELQAKAAMALLQADWSQVQGQLEVNKVEAAHAGNFVAGWRPFIGWICGASLAYTYVGQPLVAFCFGLYAGHLPPMPGLDTGTLMSLLMGMLGLAGMRTFEKVQGKA